MDTSVVDLGALLLAESPDALIATTLDGRILQWTGGATNLFGFDAGEAEGSYLSDLIVPDDKRRESNDRLHEVLEKGFNNYESIRQRKDGSLLCVDISNKLVRDPVNGTDIVVSSKKDITELKITRDSRLVSARFGNLLESTPDGIVMVNATGHIILANGHAEKMFGYSGRDLIGKPVETLLPIRLRDNHIQHRSSYMTQPRVRSMGAGLELNGLRQDGSEFPVEISLSPLETETGTLVMSAIRDISERKKAEQKFRDLLEAAPDAMVIVGQNGRILLINSQTEKLFGYDREELMDKPVETLIPERFRDKHPSHRDQFFRDPKFRPMGMGLELFGRRKDSSEFPVEISLSPLETEGGTLVSSAIRDITERKRFETALQEKNLELVAANQAKDHFLASMSHELRTPLNAILGFTGTLLMQLPGSLNRDQQKQLETVRSSAQHLLSLINDLLDLSKIEAGKTELYFENIDCGELINEIVGGLQPQANRKCLELSINLPENPIILNTDRRALSQILINLISNAIKFTDSGSIIVQARRGGQRDQQTVVIAVRDSGTGIPCEDQERLFAAFTQLSGEHRARGQGTGLGLYLSRRLAELLDGNIKLESEPDQGSTFTLTLKDK